MDERNRRSLFLVALAIVTWCPHVAFAKANYVAPDDVVLDSDLIVVGTLSQVHEWTEDGTDYGVGRIDIQHVVVGDATNSESVTLTWDNPTDRICPRVSHGPMDQRLALWFLSVEVDGTVRAVSSRHALALDSPERLRSFLSELGDLRSRRISTVREWLEGWLRSSKAGGLPLP